MVTAGQDKYLKVWDRQGTLLCSLNINHPLPVSWNYCPDPVGKEKSAIMFSLKVVELLFRRNGTPSSLSTDKLQALNSFLRDVSTSRQPTVNDFYLTNTQMTEHKPQE